MRSATVKLARMVKSISLRQLNSIRNRVFTLKQSEAAYGRFHSQFGEDRYVFRNIPLPKQGVFVDVGAGHPIHLSNTYFFERNGWTGICVDADPVHYELLRNARANVQWAAIAQQEGEVQFSQAYLPSFSSAKSHEQSRWSLRVPIRSTITVPALRLETVLERHGIGLIDLLSIDVEGSELEVWNSFDHQTHKPRIVIIEFDTFGLASQSANIIEHFSHLPYKLVHTTCTNHIFLSTER